MSKYLDLTGLKKIIDWAKSNFVYYKEDSDGKYLCQNGNIINQITLKDDVSTYLPGGYRGISTTIYQGLIQFSNDASNYIQINYDGITQQNGLSTECFTRDGNYYDLTKKLDTDATITEEEINNLFK